MIRRPAKARVHSDTPIQPLAVALDAATWASVIDKFAFSPQQARIVELVLQGKRDKEIAAELSLSLSTVRAYLGRVFDRTGVRDRVGLVLGVFAIAREIEKTKGNQHE